MPSSSPKKRGKRELNSENVPRHLWLENIGLIVVAILILAITLTRYWHNIHWRAR
ncbi:MAG TPA: hypothetical protein VHV29_19260 [Terriglobales bacterium]|nr:hypothetical protein [Terriglobales bacterium]